MVVADAPAWQSRAEGKERKRHRRASVCLFAPAVALVTGRKGHFDGASGHQ
jgi:hypothetical protein